MAKKIIANIKLQIKAGKATPSPPIGPALGQQPGHPAAQERHRLPLQLGLPVLIGLEYGPRARAEGAVVQEVDVGIQEKQGSVRRHSLHHLDKQIIQGLLRIGA